MCNKKDKPPQNSAENAIPSKGFSKSSRNPLKKNLIASGNANTTNTSPTIPTLIFNLSLISFINTTNIRIINEKTKEYLTFFSFISVSARPVFSTPTQPPYNIRNFQHISKEKA